MCGLSLVLALWVTMLSAGEAALKPLMPTVQPDVEQRTPDGKEAVASAIERLQRTGAFNHPDYPWVVRARRVQGDTLYFVEFLRRSEDGKGVDRVGKAVQATLAFSSVHEPFRLPFDEAAMPPVRRDTLRVHVCQMDMHTEDMDVFLDERIFDLPLPSRLREIEFRPYAEAEVCLSEEQRKVLDKSYPLSPKQKLLLAAFGDESAELLQGVWMSESGQTVVAGDKAGVRDRGSRCHFSRIAVARFDKTGTVVLRFQGKDVSVDKRSVVNLLFGDESQPIIFRGAGGLKFVLPRIEVAP